MGKPIDKIEFWKKRIDTALRPHYSVYIVHDHAWKYIFETHKQIIADHIRPTDRVLDAGCGFGRMSVLFDNYVGTDFSPDFIELAKKQYPGKTFVQGNLKELPFKDGEFDWAICVSIKRMVQDNLGDAEWEMMQEELKRVCKKILVLEYEDPKPFEII